MVERSSKLTERLTKLNGLSKRVRIRTGFPGEPDHHGFILGIGRSLVLLHQFHDFYPEGYTALRLEDIQAVRHGEHERFWERMFKGEGILDRVGIPYEVPLDDLRSLLSALSKRRLHVILECERKESDEADFFIGRLVSVGKKSVSLLYFDPLGRWDEGPDVISYEAITKVEFDTPYINTISKYIRRSPKPRP